MMTDPVLLLQQVAKQLQQEGKTPSLALFRARVAGRIAPQQLFAAYQNWRNNPIVAASSEPMTPAIATPLAENSNIDGNLTDTLARIEAKLDLLISKLEP